MLLLLGWFVEVFGFCADFAFVLSFFEVGLWWFLVFTINKIRKSTLLTNTFLFNPGLVEVRQD